MYRRPSRRGGNGERREFSVTSIRQGPSQRRRRVRIVPYIRMSGQWLERLGFRRGDRIEVTAERERLILTVVRDEPELPVN